MLFNCISKICFFCFVQVFFKAFLLFCSSVVSNPNIDVGYEATNILLETKKNPQIKEVIDLIISSYERFFLNLNSYSYMNFRKKADLKVIN